MNFWGCDTCQLLFHGGRLSRGFFMVKGFLSIWCCCLQLTFFEQFYFWLILVFFPTTSRISCICFVLCILVSTFLLHYTIFIIIINEKLTCASKVCVSDLYVKIYIFNQTLYYSIRKRSKSKFNKKKVGIEMNEFLFEVVLYWQNL